MNPLAPLGLALGVSFAAGLNLYATVLALGVLQRFGAVELPAGLQILGHPVVLGIAATLYVVEFFADKIPFVDSAWDLVHTFIRPPAAAVLAYAAVHAIDEPWRLAAALLAGGVALTSHGTKATTRAASHASPEPASNWLLSLGEDGAAFGLVWLAATHPVAALGVVVLLTAVAVVLLILFWKFLRGVHRRVRPGGAAAGRRRALTAS